MNLKCSACVDEHILDSTVIVADAITMSPVVQVLNTSMGATAAVVAIPLCENHRAQQITKAKSGLVAA